MIVGLITLVIVLGTVAGSVWYGRRRARTNTVAEWAVGGRKFKFLIFWFLNAGEIYTTFAVLGIAGYAWAYGAPAYLSFLSVSLAAAVGYWLTPLIWAAGARGGLITQADFFADHYRARWLGVLVGLAGIAALVIYVRMQITALGLILQLTVGDISQVTAAVAAAIIMIGFVFLAGLRSAAFAAGVKDVLMLLAVVLLSLTVASHVGAASIVDVFRELERRYPGVGALPGRQPDSGLGTIWLMTTAMNVGISTYVFPRCSSSVMQPPTPGHSDGTPSFSRSIHCATSSSSCSASVPCSWGRSRSAETSTRCCRRYSWIAIRPGPLASSRAPHAFWRWCQDRCSCSRPVRSSRATSCCPFVQVWAKGTHC